MLQWFWWHRFWWVYGLRSKHMQCYHTRQRRLWKEVFLFLYDGHGSHRPRRMLPTLWRWTNPIWLYGFSLYFFLLRAEHFIYIYDSLILLAAQLSEIDEIQEQCVLECYNNYDDAYADEYVEEFMVCAQNSCDVSIPDNIGCRNTCYSDHMPAWDVRGLVNCFQSCEE